MQRDYNIAHGTRRPHRAGFGRICGYTVFQEKGVRIRHLPRHTGNIPECHDHAPSTTISGKEKNQGVSRASVERVKGDYSWGGERKKVYYSGPEAKPSIHPKVKGILDNLKRKE